MALLAATDTLHPDEPAFLLMERNGLTPDSKSLRRWQVIKVVRGDKLVDWRKDLGPSSEFKAREFNILGGDVDERGRGQTWETVGSLMEMAEEMRDPNRAIARDNPDLLTRDWGQAFVDEMEQRKRAAVGRKVFQT